jgi:hypothetical protein
MKVAAVAAVAAVSSESVKAAAALAGATVEVHTSQRGCRPTDSERKTPRFAYLGLWARLLGYVVLAAPGGSPEASAIDLELIKKIVSAPFDGTTNPIFVALQLPWHHPCAACESGSAG